MPDGTRLSPHGSDPSSSLSPLQTHLRTIDDLRHREKPAPIVPNFLFGRSIAFLYGESQTGKTFILLDAALGIASGTGAWGRQTVSGCTVYVAGEGQAGIYDRIAAWMTHHGVVEDPPLRIHDAAINLLDDTAVDGFIADLHQHALQLGQPVKLVCIDTLATCFGDGDENLSRDVRKFLASCNRIAKTFGCAVVIAHHSGKTEGRGLRGHSSMLANADTVLHVRHGDEPGAVVVEAEKQKDSRRRKATFRLVNVGVENHDDEDGESLVAVFDGDCPSDSVPAPIKEPRLNPKHRAAYEVLLAAGAPGLSEDEWRARAKTEHNIGVERRALFGEARDRLVKLGFVLKDGERFVVKPKANSVG